MKITNERELKLGAGPRFKLPDLPGERLAPRSFTSVYFDTPDHRLAAAGLTLRRRLESGQGRWQLKLPRGPARLELELPEGARSRARGDGRRGMPVPPARFIDLVTAYTRGAPLLPVATLRSRRQGVMVRDARGPVAEVVLDSVDVMDGRRPARRFREVEVELTGGDETALTRLEQMLRAAGATDGDGRPKLLRALDLEPASPPAPLLPSAPPADRLRNMIATQVGLIVAHDPGTRLAEDPEELHQMRVACRRLRALLREARPMLEAESMEPLRTELAWLGGELGAVRDLDVLRQHLSDEIASLDPADARGGARLIRALEAERARVRGGLLTALDSDRYLRLLAALDEAARQLPVSDGGGSLEAMAAEAFRRLRKAVRRLGGEPSGEALHEIRIKAKRARYAAELVAPVVGKPAERFVEHAKAFQDLLGDCQDALIAQQKLREIATRTRGPAAALVAGRLIERQAARHEEKLWHFRKRWRKLQKRGLKAWR